ncbi:DUF2155 domain-containing protein [Caulobacter sp.]|uniref:DUF2155 domain-containing protein n=1 Tax=Caulobacter sp. TaxID=78 RepID=UPI003BA89141
MRRSVILGATVAVVGLVLVGSAAARQSAAPVAPAAPQAPVAPAPQPQVAREATPAPQAAPTQIDPTAKPTPAPKPVATTPTKPAEPAEPVKRGRSSVAIIQALDKVTTETMRFEAPIGQPIRYKTLIFTVRACETAAPDEVAPESAAYVVIDTQPKAVAGRVAPPGRQVYKGWMYANSPGMNPLQHPVYDAWLIACKASAPVAPVDNR